MAKRQHQQEDPWAGFVDVLSNVVMVVTFIVIILGIAMFALSQQIAQNIAKKIIEAKCETPGDKLGDSEKVLAGAVESREVVEGEADAAAATGGGAPAPDPGAAAPTAPSGAPTAANGEAAEVETPTVGEGDARSEGDFRVTLGRPELLEDEIEGDQTLTVRAQQVVQDEIDSVAPEDRETVASGDVSDARDALAVIGFADASFQLTPEATEAITASIQRGDVPADAVFEVRAIALSKIGSISEARRLGFYRAMSVRGALLAAGVPPERIMTRMRESADVDDSNNVYVFLQQ